MAPIRWETFITDEQGVVDYQRVRSLVSVLLAIAGGAIAVLAGVWEILLKHELPHDAVLIAVGALVLPITGGKITDAIAARRAG
jgi:hypothetical protein